MIKNKEDDFLGDSITNNIKFAANEWQAQGSVDRTSMYTAEGILDLIFEDTQYDKETGMHKYTPRASFTERNFAPAKLSHDIILVNKLFYQSSPLTSYKNIFGLDDFLNYGIGVVNPVYDTLARDEKIILLNKDKIVNGECAISDMTITEFCSIFNPNSFTSTKGDLVDFSENANAVAGSGNRFEAMASAKVVAHLKDIYYKPSEGSIPDFGKATMRQILASPGFDTERFINDFSLTLHDPESIRLPYFTRKSDDNISNQEKFKFFTRYFPNLSVVNEDLASGYVEKVSPIMEDLLNSADLQIKGTYADGTSLDVKGFALDSSTGDSFTSPTAFNSKTNLSKIIDEVAVGGVLSEKWENVIPKEYIADAVNLASALSFIGNALQNGGYNNFLSDLYLGWDSANNILNSTGIHLVVEEDKSAIFRSDDDENYTIYSGLVLGYRLVDNLIAQRTFLGTVFQLAAGWDDSEAVKTNWQTQPFNKTQKSTVTLASGNAYKLQRTANTYMGYCTVDMLKYLVVGSNTETTFSEFIMDLREVNNLEDFNADYLRPFYRWLKEETFLFKTPIYGDFVEELNFMQDLNPDSKVQFAGARIKRTSIPYKRFQDSKYEVPYIEKTAPLINLSDAKKTTRTHASDAIAGKGYVTQTKADKETGVVPGSNTTPPFIYDYDKGDEENKISGNIDERSKTAGSYKQRVNDVDGDFTVEGRILGKTIDELWQFLKFLSESTGHGLKGNNLPKFYGLLSNELGFEINDKDAEPIRVNPKYSGKADNPEIDILDWEPLSSTEYKPYYSSEVAPELTMGGYKITKAIPKVLDYKVKFFGRKDVKDGSEYEYNTEDSDYGDVAGYLDQLLNNTSINFNSNALGADVDAAKLLDSFGDTSFNVADPELIPALNEDKGILENKNFKQVSVNREKALIKIGKVLSYHEHSFHNHYKEYLDNPKNLKTIERDLEAIRQNLQTLAEYSVLNFAVMGFADRSTNRGTLHTLHRNSFDFNDTFLEDDEDSLNNTADTLNVAELDKKVVFDDGDFDSRYQHHVIDGYGKNDYDANKIDLSGAEVNVREPHEMYKPNITLLSEVYMAADGTWRSIHEHVILPILDDDY